MTFSPPTTGTAAAARRGTAPVGVRRSPRVSLAPARTVAVIVPPTTLYAASIALVTAALALLAPQPWGWGLVRASVLTAVLVPLVHLARVILTARGYAQLRYGLPAAALGIYLMLDGILPGAWLPVPVTVILLACALVIQPLAWAWRVHWLRQRPARATLLASTEIGAADAIRQIEAVPGIQISNVVIPGCNPWSMSRFLGRRVLASLDAPGAVLKHLVVVSCPLRDARVSSDVARLVARGHVIVSESRVLRRAEGRVDTTRADALNILMSRPSHRLARAASLVLDFAIATTLLVLLAPLMAVIAILVKREDGGPALYAQKRVGAGGRIIRVLKFRSMRPDAEALSGPVWAEEDDPRVTRIGRILRRYRLDELPQLFNVLGGSMALVGPRPERPHFCDALREDIPLFELRTIVRPGITGWAQVRSAYAAGTEAAREKLSLDLFYVLHRSPWFDLAILFETVSIAFSGRGAR